MDLSDLKVGLGELSDEQLQDLLLSIRHNRRVSKKPVVEAKPKVAKAKTEKPASASVAAILAALSPAQRLELLAKLKGGS